MLDTEEKYCVVVGGANGLGAAFVDQLKNRYDKVYVLDRVAPTVDNQNTEFIQLDLAKDALEPQQELILHSQALIITAGIGRVEEFAKLDLPEIEKVVKVNLLPVLKLIKMFYPRLLTATDAYCLTMGSLAGELSSPLFSVYSATKAALNRFAESVNIELEKSGTANRITNIMPISFKGSSFNGGETNLSELTNLAEECLTQMFNHASAYIPDYDSVCKGILERYHTDAHTFGLSSYDYKITNNRINPHRQYTIGYLSGTFDLFHIGHLNLIRRAKEQCDYLIVGVHKDASHKGKQTFISFENRQAIVGACKYVDKVVMSEREDSDAWLKYHYDKLFVGSDYKGTERFQRYEEYFKDKNVEITYFPYTQGVSSTELRSTLSDNDKSPSQFN